MGRTYETITDPLAAFIAMQPVFFVATAPQGSDGHVNLSPKGADTLRVTGPTSIAYLDFAGSAAETIAHIRDNGRVTIMWCSFGPRPRILRVYGRGRHLLKGDSGFTELSALFADYTGTRSIITVEATRIADSCGFGVPEMELIGPRERMLEWADNQTPDELESYMRKNNTTSIDGLPAWRG